MKQVFAASCPRTVFGFALVLFALLAAPAMLSAEEAPVIGDSPNLKMQKAESQAAPVDEVGLPTLQFAASGEINNLCDPICTCRPLTATATRVGATCLKARQKAAAAARALAVCGGGSTSCSAVTHSVAPCVPITNGFSATATAYFSCETCRPGCV